MIYALAILTRVVIGSTLGIVFFGAVMGTIGKAMTAQIIWPYAIAWSSAPFPVLRQGEG
jgi:uncharacterized protein